MRGRVTIRFPRHSLSRGKMVWPNWWSSLLSISPKIPIQLTGPSRTPSVPSTRKPFRSPSLNHPRRVSRSLQILGYIPSHNPVKTNDSESPLTSTSTSTSTSASLLSSMSWISSKIVWHRMSENCFYYPFYCTSFSTVSTCLPDDELPLSLAY